MKKILILLLLTACELPLKEKTSSIQNSDLELLQNIENEEYKMITTAVSPDLSFLVRCVQLF